MISLPAKLSQKLTSCKTLPSPPKVAERIIELSQDKTADADDVGKTISLDPALTSKVLQLCGSPMYLRSRKVSNLSQAVVLLGLNTILNFALSLSLVSSLSQQKVKGINYSLFWRRTLIGATSARALCPKIGVGRVDAENYFLAGLLQDVGMLALNEADHSVYRDIGPKQVDHDYVCGLEREALGVDHAGIGAWLHSQWKLPEYLQHSVNGSHDVTSVNVPEEDQKVVQSTRLSGVLADVWLVKGESEACEQAAGVAAELFDLSGADLHAIMEDTAENLVETSELFGLDLGSQSDYDKTIQNAVEVFQ